MTMSDPIADMLSRVRNANHAHHESVSMPSSKIKANIADILKQEGYITDYSVDEAKVGNTLTIELKYGDQRDEAITGLRRVSKPGLRVYAKANELPEVLGGLGVAIISTSRGLLTDRQASEKGVGGEVLAYVW
ncbi:30S ribosomal protein S8 [Corynebacterium otitidis]|uniref:Small ribosomal subunit protein uS8 n=1 Tax=Corynebacterium otitidis ATCC 51513 TaxID=883169 RepID=I7KK67_9CORY|nr:30S ribosomal protein S8 [Corynebacterium otitidis]EJZ81496.1 30S ribosomal protein S8 [Corynebacterium otitidis ATCC 51513]CCI84160.1 30S ribosomal protein S8 [Corynebacterium otitidis ATCC 51513]